MKYDRFLGEPTALLSLTQTSSFMTSEDKKKDRFSKGKKKNPPSTTIIQPSVRPPIVHCGENRQQLGG